MNRTRAHLVAAIILSLSLPISSVFATEIKVNENNNNGAQTVSNAVAEYPDILLGSQTYYGVYSTGPTAQTTVNIDGGIDISFQEANTLGTTLQGQAYGIYTSNGSQTALNSPTTSANISIVTWGNQSNSYGVYTTGANSKTTVGTQDNPTEILVGAAANENITTSSATDTATAGSPTAKAYAVFADNAANNDITATKIMSTAGVASLAEAGTTTSATDETIAGTALAGSPIATSYAVFSDHSATNKVVADVISSEAQALVGAMANANTYGPISTGGHATGGSPIVNAYAVSADHASTNIITANTISAIARGEFGARAEAERAYNTATGGIAIGGAPTVNTYAIWADHSANNIVTAKSVDSLIELATAANADATVDNLPTRLMSPSTLSPILRIPAPPPTATGGTAIGGNPTVNAYALFANHSATNTLIADEISSIVVINTATSATATNNRGGTAIDGTIIPGSIYGALYGVYGADNSTTNLYSYTGDTLSILLGTNAPELKGYATYLSAANLNLHTNIDVQSIEDTGNVLKSPITYFEDSAVTFADRDAFHTYTSSTGALQLEGSNTFTVQTDLINSNSNVLSFATLSNESSGINYITVANDPSIIENSKGTILGKATVIKIADADNLITTSGNQYQFINANGVADTVTFTGKTRSVDSILKRYDITPIVSTETDSEESKNVIITAINYDTAGPAEGPLTASDAQLSMRNIGLMDNNTLMHRMGDLQLDTPDKTGIWAKFNKGKLSSNSSYGRSFNQNYDQIYIGYDKQHLYTHSKLYTGIAISHLSSTVDYQHGNGKTKSTAVSLYGTWFGDKGHYLDVVAKAGRLTSNYSVQDTSNQPISASYGTPAYSLSAEYGFRKQLANDYFIEPQAQFTLGRIQGVDYALSNGVSIHQGGINSAVGRIGILGGKQFGQSNNVYAKVSLLKDFGGSGNMAAYYGLDSIHIDTAPGNGTWVEVGIGANIKPNKNANLYMDLLRTFGGNITQKWQVNLGSRWKF